MSKKREFGTIKCVLFGHKYVIETHREYTRDDGEDMRETRICLLPWCVRCGHPKPCANAQDGQEQNTP